MIKQSTFDFLKKLRENNYREWFHEHKAEYDAAKQDVLDTIAEMLVEINKFDKSIGFPDPRKCMFRIARDIRFSSDKSPYKSHFGIIINREGSTRSEYSGYYVHVEPGNSFVSCGVYMPMPDTTKAIRIKIDEEWKDFSAIINKKVFKETFQELSRDDDVLTRVPAGFDKNSPAAEILKLKHFYVFVGMRNKEVIGKDFIKKAIGYFRLMRPLSDFLNDAIREK
jgi:uncharacterized protein (TIGR02453 family)